MEMDRESGTSRREKERSRPAKQLQLAFCSEVVGDGGEGKTNRSAWMIRAPGQRARGVASGPPAEQANLLVVVLAGHAELRLLTRLYKQAQHLFLGNS